MKPTLLALTALSLVALAPQAHAQSASSADVIERGREVYLSTGCWQCHGYEAQGGAGPRIGPSPMPAPLFNRYVRGPTGAMPPYSERVLADEDLAAIHAYLTSLQRPSVTLPPQQQRSR